MRWRTLLLLLPLALASASPALADNLADVSTYSLQDVLVVLTACVMVALGFIAGK